MAFTTVNGVFNELLQRIELNPSRARLVSERYQRIKETLESGITGCEVFQIGSFQRKTKIRPDDENAGLDIDVGVCLGEFYSYVSTGGISPDQALRACGNVLVDDGQYRTMSPYEEAPTVIIEYADGFKIELVPCYRDKSGKYPRADGPDCFVVGDNYNNWQPADYKYDAEIISGLNQVESVKQALVPSIKMIKRFLRNYNSPLKSFHIEILCASIIPEAVVRWVNGNKNWHYKHILAYFLSETHELLTGSIRLEGSYSIPINSGQSESELSQLGSALNRLGEHAWELCKLSDNNSAIKQWSEFFGHPFPAT